MIALFVGIVRIIILFIFIICAYIWFSSSVQRLVNTIKVFETCEALKIRSKIDEMKFSYNELFSHESFKKLTEKTNKTSQQSSTKLGNGRL